MYTTESGDCPRLDDAGSTTPGPDGEGRGYGKSEQIDDASLASSSAEEEVAAKAWFLRFRINTSRRYNARRALYFGRLQKLAQVSGVVGGSAAMAGTLTAVGASAQAVGLGVVILTASSLVFGWPERARLHQELYRRYTTLLERLVRLGDKVTIEVLQEAEADFTLIEADEPAINNALMMICYNEEVLASGADPATQKPLSRLQRWLAPVIDLYQPPAA